MILSGTEIPGSKSSALRQRKSDTAVTHKREQEVTPKKTAWQVTLRTSGCALDHIGTLILT